MDNTSTSVVPSTLADVWTSVGTFFTDALADAITLISGNALLVAPLVVFVSSKVLGQAKSLFKLGGRRR